MSLLIIIFCFLSFPNLSLGSPAAVRKSLLFNVNETTYDTMVRPRGSGEDSVYVNVSMSLNQLGHVDEKHEVITANLWIRYIWIDPRLSWDPDQFDGTKMIKVRRSEVWIPDMTIYNDVREEARDLEEYPISVDYTGKVKIAAPIQLMTTCKMNIHYFPFDQQVCRIKVGSWAYHGKQLDIRNVSMKGDITSFVENSEWTLRGFETRRTVTKYDCCPEPYPDVSFFIIIRRREMHYLINLVIPVIVIVFVSLIGFFLPPSEGERMSLAITNLLAMTVYLILVSENLPPQSKVFPLMMEYFYYSFVIMALTCVFNIISLSTYYKGEITGMQPSEKVKELFLNYLGPVWGIIDKRDDYRKRASLKAKDSEGEDTDGFDNDAGNMQMTEMSQRGKRQLSIEDSNSALVPKQTTSCDCCLCNMGKYYVKEKPGSKCSCDFCNLHVWCSKSPKAKQERKKIESSELSDEYDKNKDELETREEFQEDEDMRAEATFNWQMIAVISDRYFFLFSTIIYIIGVFLIFFKPRFYDDSPEQKANSY